MSGPRPGEGLGCYVHIPFCAERCDYCAFSTFTDRSHLIEAYVAACCAQLEACRAAGEGPFATIFVGGGTPSLCSPAQLEQILAAVDARSASEVSIECNPESVSDELLERIRAAGATRISLGVQSLHPHVLAGLGRRQDDGAVARALSAVVRAGFEHYNVDLVYGGAGETDEDWRATLTGVLELERGLSHVSAYALTVEHGTPLARDRARHPDDDVLADRYVIADEVLSGAGMAWYEISNWARPGEECAHNRSCWDFGEYVAIGSAAHGHRNGLRYANVATPERYIERIAQGRSAVARRFVSSPATREVERLELALRTRDGVPAGALDARDEALSGLVEHRGERTVLTRRGRLLANEVAIRLVAPRADRPSTDRPSTGRPSPSRTATECGDRW